MSPDSHLKLTLFSDTKDGLETNVSVLQNNFAKVTKEVEILEENVRFAQSLQERLEKLSTSEDFMSNETIDQTTEKVSRKRKKLQDLEERLSKAKKVKEEIEHKKQDPKFLTKENIAATLERIEKTQQVLKTMTGSNNASEISFNQVLQVQSDARKELECSVCLQVPRTEVFSCTEHHILCSDCKKKILKLCPVCRQNFAKIPPARNRLAEKMILRLN